MPTGATTDLGGVGAGSSGGGEETEALSTEYVLENMATLSVSILKRKIAELGLVTPPGILKKTEFI